MLLLLYFEAVHGQDHMIEYVGIRFSVMFLAEFRFGTNIPLLLNYHVLPRQ